MALDCLAEGLLWNHVDENRIASSDISTTLKEKKVNHTC